MVRAVDRDMRAEAALPVIECRDLCYAFPQPRPSLTWVARAFGRKIDAHAAPTPVTQGLSLGVAAGEIYCLLGPNGAGKTTLIRQITGEIAPQSGAVDILGRPCRALRAEDPGAVGILPQDANLFKALTVQQHLAIFADLKIGAAAARSQAITDCVEAFGLAPLLARRASTLSLGQTRLVLVALACLSKPALLILDEPTVGMDPAVRSALWRILSDLRDSGTAILLTTHYMDEAETLADRIGFLSGGRIAKEGSLHDLRQKLGRSIRLSVTDPQTGQVTRRLLFGDPVEATHYVTANRITFYALERIPLEEVYFRLLEQEAPEDTPQPEETAV